MRFLLVVWSDLSGTLRDSFSQYFQSHTRMLILCGYTVLQLSDLAMTSDYHGPSGENLARVLRSSSKFGKFGRNPQELLYSTMLLFKKFSST